MDIILEDPSASCDHYSSRNSKENVVNDRNDVYENSVAIKRDTEEHLVLPVCTKPSDSLEQNDVTLMKHMSDSSVPFDVYSVVDRNGVDISSVQPVQCASTFICSSSDMQCDSVNVSPPIQEDIDKFCTQSEINANNTGVLQSMYSTNQVCPDKNSGSNNHHKIASSMLTTGAMDSNASVSCDQNYHSPCPIDPSSISTNQSFYNLHSTTGCSATCNDSMETNLNRYPYLAGSNIPKLSNGVQYIPSFVESETSPKQNAIDTTQKNEHSRVPSSSYQSAVHHCLLCGKQYRHVASLRNHTRKHSSGLLTSKKYKCTYCVYSSQYHRNVIKHIESNHRNHDSFPDSGNNSNNAQNNASFASTQSPCAINLLSDDVRGNMIDPRAWEVHTSRECSPYNEIAENVHIPSQKPSLMSPPMDRMMLDSYPIYGSVHSNSSQNTTPSSYDPSVYMKPVESGYGLDNTENVIRTSPPLNAYRCEVPGCNKPFRSIKCLDNHVRDVHRDFKRFKCQFEGCSFGGQRRGHLKRHMNECHGGMHM